MGTRVEAMPAEEEKTVVVARVLVTEVELVAVTEVVKEALTEAVEALCEKCKRRHCRWM